MSMYDQYWKAVPGSHGAKIEYRDVEDYMPVTYLEGSIEFAEHVVMVHNASLARSRPTGEAETISPKSSDEVRLDHLERLMGLVIESVPNDFGYRPTDKFASQVRALECDDWQKHEDDIATLQQEFSAHLTQRTFNGVPGDIRALEDRVRALEKSAQISEQSLINMATRTTKENITAADTICSCDHSEGVQDAIRLNLSHCPDCEGVI